MKRILHINLLGSNYGGTEKILLERVNAMQDCTHGLIFFRMGDESYLKNFESSFHSSEKTLDQAVCNFQPTVVIVYNTPQISLKKIIDHPLRQQFKLIKSVHDWDMFYFGTGYNRFTKHRKKYTLNSPYSIIHWVSSFKKDLLTNVLRWENPIKKKVLLKELNSFDSIECFSEFIKELLIKNNIAASKIYKNYLWTNISSSSSTTSKISTKILFVGNLIKGKGCQLLLKAVQNLKEPWQLTIIGDGPLKSSLQSQYRDTPQIKFLGHCSQQEVIEHYQNSAILVVPSLFEPFGLVILEAFKHNLPVIAFQQGGPSELIENTKSGFLIKPFNLKALTNKIQVLLNDQHLNTNMQNYIRSMDLSRYTIENNIKILSSKL